MIGRWRAMMTRLTVLPCPESWRAMRVDGEGRHCERCDMHVHDAAKLDERGLTELAAGLELGGRSCARFELDAGRPRTKLGLAAGLVVVALAGCATAPVYRYEAGGPGSYAELEPGVDGDPELGLELADGDSDGAVLAGRVLRDDGGEPIANALIVLQGTGIDGAWERMTNARGVFHFDGIPAGEYVVQVLAGSADVSKVVRLEDRARMRANFQVDPDRGALMGVVVRRDAMLDVTSPASSYSSSLVEVD